MSDARVLQGDCREMLRALPAASVQCVVTSPPYYGLRDYGTAVWEGGDPGCDHRNTRKAVSSSTTLHADRPGAVNGLYPNEAKHIYDAQPYMAQCGRCGAVRQDAQIGLEESPVAYLQSLVDVFQEVRQVLRDDGTLWLNLGDSYANDGKWGGHTGGKHAYGLHGMPIGRMKQYTGFKPKNLMGMPWRVAFALQDDGWYLRSDIIWDKPNPMPESVQDRPTKSHEYIFLLSKSPTYYYDGDAIKEPVRGTAHSRGHGVNPKAWKVPTGWDTEAGSHTRLDGRYPRSKQNPSFSAAVTGLVTTRNKRSVWTVATYPYPDAHFATFPPKLIEPCILAGSRPGDTVLDPFAGSGTTLAVALQHRRRAIGIELNPDYCRLIKKRLNGVQVTLPWEAAQ